MMIDGWRFVGKKKDNLRVGFLINLSQLFHLKLVAGVDNLLLQSPHAL